MEDKSTISVGAVLLANWEFNAWEFLKRPISQASFEDVFAELFIRTYLADSVITTVIRDDGGLGIRLNEMDAREAAAEFIEISPDLRSALTNEIEEAENDYHRCGDADGDAARRLRAFASWMAPLVARIEALKMNPLKQAFERGEIIEYRVRGSDGDWLLCPPEWDERAFEYREYHPLTLPPPMLSSAQQAAVDLANKLIAQKLAADQAAASMLRFDKAYKPLPWWRRVLRTCWRGARG